MGTPRTPQNTMINMVYPTPDSIRFKPETIKPLDPTYLPVENDHRASDDEYEWLPSGTASKRSRNLNDPTYRPTGDDHQQLDDDYEWLPFGTKRPRKSKAVDPTYLPVADDDQHSGDEYEWLPSRTKRARKPKIIDPTYRPEYVPGDSDDGSMSPTQRRLSRKRKGISSAVTKTVEGHGQGHLFMRPPKRVKLSNLGKAQVKADSKTSPHLSDAADHAHHTERPATPKGQTLNPTVYPTPSSPVSGLSAKELSSQFRFVNPKFPIWKSVNSLKPELPDDERDPSWDSPKSLMRGRSMPRGSDDDDLYLPPSKAVKIVFSRRQLLLTGADYGLSDDDDDEFDDERGVSKNETKGVVYDFSLERAKRWAAAVSLPENAWSETEKELFFRLAMRGFEPLMPRHWQHDFSTLPDTMFSLPEEEIVPIIRAFKHSDFHAIKSLLGLFSLSGQVRDCNILRTRPEDKIRKAIKKYVRWAMRDADIHEKPGTIPVYTIHSQKEGESVVSAVSKLNNRLGKLAKRYHNTLGMSPRRTSQHKIKKAGAQIKQEFDTDLRITSRCNFPLLVGFVICGPIVAILTLNTDPLSPKGWGEGTGSKFISQFDVGERGQDVWTSLALAITIMHIRKTMIQLADGGKGGFCRNGGDGLFGEDEDL